MQVIWAYSFWARRWNDGCISLCRRILDKILETWPNKTCTTATMAKTEQYYRANRRNSNYSREELLQELENAFADAPRPEVETILLDEMEIGKRAEIGEIFSRYAWQEIPAATLYQNAEALSCFTPQGFRYYLPAFLSETIRNDNPEKISSLLCSVPLLISGCLRNMDGIISPFSPPNREKPFTIASNGWPQTMTTLPSIHRNYSRQPKAGGCGMKNEGNREETSFRKNRIKYNMYKSKICLE